MSRTACLAALALLAAAPAAAEPAMWRVADADTEIILFGTLHKLPANVEWLSPRVAARLDAADTLVLEVVIPDDRGALVTAVTELGYSPKTPPLSARIAPSRRDRLDAVVATTGLYIAALDRMETWLAAMTIGEATLARLGLDSAGGVETVLTARARARGTRIEGLETIPQQLGFFDTLPETDQRAMLDATVDDASDAAAETAKLVSAWRAGDTAGIAAAFAEPLRATPRLARVLLTDRNAAWAAWVERRLAQPGRVFVAVGAAHLAGTDAVQAKLAARGLKVERLP